MSVMGAENKKFDVPVCNSFQAKVLNDQLCYEVDPNEYRNILTKEWDSGEKKGIKFYVDTSFERQTTLEKSEFMIYLDTLGNQNVSK